MDSQRQTISEAGAYRIVEMVVRDLEAAARILGNREAVMPDPRGVVRRHGLRPFCKSMPDGAAIVSAAPSDARQAGPEVPRSPGRLSRATFLRRYFISPRRHGACRSCSASPTF